MIKSKDLLVFLREYGEYTVKASFNFEDKVVTQTLIGSELLIYGNTEFTSSTAVIKKGGYTVEIVKK